MRERAPQTIPEVVESIPLPPLPQVLIRLLTLAEDERTPVGELAALVAQDPALTAHLLTVANSPPFRKETASYGLKSCLTAIGPRILRTLATSMAVQNVFTSATGDQHLDFTGFWSNSLRVAELARALAVATDYPDTEEAYLSGLLHDIGQLLLVSGLAEGYGLSDGTTPDGAGLKSHDVAYRAVLGSKLVEQWNLFSFMADAVLFHRHTAEEITSADLLSRIVWSAHKLSCCETTEDAPQIPEAEIEAISLLTGIDAAGIAAACLRSRERVVACAASLGVDLSRAGQVFLGTSFIEHELPFAQRHHKDAARLHLEAQVRTMAVMQPLQQSLLSLTDEAAIYGALRESARILFGLGRPAFMTIHPDRNIITGTELAGQSPMLTRLEIQPDSAQSLAAAVLRENRPRATFDDDYPPKPFLSDMQISRTMRSEGILCIPMRSGERPIGVMVFGLSAERSTRTHASRAWISGFASIAANTLETFRTLRSCSVGIEAELTRHFEQKARKVVHEVVNPLSIINNYLQIVSQKMESDPGASRELDILKEEISRVERIIRKLGDQAEQLPAVETVNVNSVIEGMLALYGESLFEANGITVDSYPAPELPVARADRDSLKQILLNLLKNSSEAMPDGGRLRITTRVVSDATAGGTVEIHLSDTGPGMPPDVIECLFQPLSPDRRPAHSGVGLSIVASLVDQLGGTISCQSDPDKGTEFTIRLHQARKDTL